MRKLIILPHLVTAFGMLAGTSHAAETKLIEIVCCAKAEVLSLAPLQNNTFAHEMRYRLLETNWEYSRMLIKKDGAWEEFFYDTENPSGYTPPDCPINNQAIHSDILGEEAMLSAACLNVKQGSVISIEYRYAPGINEPEHQLMPAGRCGVPIMDNPEIEGDGCY